MPPSPARSLSTTSRKKSSSTPSTSSKVNPSETHAPSPVQVTSASIYSASGHDDPQPGDPQDHPDSDDEEDDYPVIEGEGDEVPAQSLLPPPSFEPLFALVTEPQSNITHHPSVYYVFSDDAENEREGSDVATIAAIKALEHDYPPANEAGDPQDDDLSDEERYIILDLEPTNTEDNLGLRLKNITSLSPSWAITSADLRPAPTFDEDVDTSGALMLKLEGIELADSVATSYASRRSESKQDTERRAANLLQEARKRGGGHVVEGMSDLFGQFSKGMAVLDKVNKDRPPEDIKI